MAPVLLGPSGVVSPESGPSMSATVAAFATRAFDVLMVALVFTVMS